MIILWVCQGILNMVAVLYFARWVLFRKQGPEAAWEEKLTAALNVVEVRLKEVERDVSEYRRKMESDFSRLSKACERNSELLQVAAFADNKVPSLEESELKSAIDTTRDALAIPTYEQLQKTKARLRSEMPLDLRTVLEDQLS